MKFVNQHRLRYSIRKLSIGAASVLLGATLLVQLPTNVQAANQTTETITTTVPIRYLSVDQEQLTEIEKTLIHHESLSTLVATETDTVIAVYQVNPSVEALPNTGDIPMPLAVLGGLTATALIFVVFTGKKRHIMNILVLGLAASSTVLAMDQLMPLNDRLDNVQVGSSLNEDVMSGYSYVGYLLDEEIEKDSPLYQYLHPTVEDESNLVEIKESADVSKSDKVEKSESITETTDENKVEIPNQSTMIELVPSNYPIVELPEYPAEELEEQTVTVEVPNNYPTVELPEYSEDDLEIPSVPSDYPVVELPEYPESDLEVSLVPNNYPTVESPEYSEDDLEIPSDPSNYPTIELPEYPESTVEVSSVPNNYPTVELVEYPENDLEVSSVPSDYPVIELPEYPESGLEVSSVPSNYPVIELPEYPESDLEVSLVPNNYPTVEVPDYPIENLVISDANIPLEPNNPIHYVPNEFPVVELPVSVEVLIEELAALRESAESYVQLSDKTPNSRAKYEKAHDIAIQLASRVDNMIEKGNLTSEEVDLLTEGLKRTYQVLNTAKLSLLPIIDTTQLALAKNELEKQVSLNNKTPNSIDKYRSEKLKIQTQIDLAIARANSVIGNLNATQSEVTEALNQVISAKQQKDALQSHLVEIADNRSLRTALNALNAELAQPVNTVDKTPATVSAYTQVKNQAVPVKNEANTLLNNLNATSSEIMSMTQRVNKVLTDIQSARNSLQPIANKDALRTAKMTLEQPTLTDGKTPNSIRTFMDSKSGIQSEIDQALMEAGKVLDNPNVTAQQVQDALTKVQQVQSKLNTFAARLVDIADNSLLQKSVNDLNTELNKMVDTTGKTEETVNAYHQAKTEAQNIVTQANQVLKDKNATATQIVAMKSQVDQALSQLTDKKLALRNKVIEELTEKKIEFKNVESAYLYRLDDNNHLVRVLSMDVADRDVSKYQIKVNLSEAKSVWLDVANIVANGDEFNVTAVRPDLIQFSPSGNVQDGYTIKVAKRSTQNGVYTSFKTLIEAMKQNPRGTFTIGSDLSASEITLTSGAGSYMKDVMFSGTLQSANNKVYTIYDLEASLLENADRATIKNIHLEDINVKTGDANYSGALAHKVEHTTIDNVSGVGSVSGNRMVAGLVGWLAENSSITNSSFTGHVTSTHSVGGLVGSLTHASRLTNSYTDVVIGVGAGEEDKAGGLVAEINQDTIVKDSFAKGTVNNYGIKEARIGGAIGAVYGRTEGANDAGYVENVVSYVKVDNGRDFIGNIDNFQPREKVLRNNYVVTGESTGVHVEHQGVTTISKASADNKTKNMYQDKGHTLVTQRNEHIENYTQAPGYRTNYSKAYRNFEKLMPFYDRNTIVKEANKLASTDSLVTKDVHSTTLYVNNALVHDFYSQKDHINQLLVRYTDGTKEMLSVSKPEYFKQSGILDFTTSKGFVYHPQQFVTDNSSLVNELVAMAKNKTYDYSLFNPSDVTNLVEKDRDKRIGRLYLEDSYQKVQEEIEQIVKGLINHTVAGDYSKGILNRYIKQKIKDNLNGLLIGSTYLHRWYNFEKVRNQLMYALEQYAPNKDSLELVTELGNESVFTLASNRTNYAYTSTIAKHLNASGSIFDFVKRTYNETKKDNQDINQWIKSQSKAYILERQSKAKPEQYIPIFERLKMEYYQPMLLPILNIDTDHVYMIFTSNSIVSGVFEAYLDGVESPTYSNYEEKKVSVRQKVDSAADDIQRYFDTLYYTLNERSGTRLSNTHMRVFDATARGYSWSPEYGSRAFPSVKALIGPIHLWNNQDSVFAYAPFTHLEERVYFAQGRLLTNQGLSVLTHEHTHNLDHKVILDGYGRRYGHGPESIARGLFQTPADPYTLGMNYIFDREKSYSPYVTYNLSAEQFKSTADVERYMRRVFDIMYTLDVAEAEAMLSRGKNYIINNYNVIDLIKGYGDYSKEDIVKSLYNVDNSGMKFESIDDLVDNGIVSGFILPRVYGSNNYYSVDVGDSNYGINENTIGTSGGYTFRRVAFELFAEKGYYGGLVPYLSNQYAAESFETHGYGASDSLILQKVFDGKYKDYKEFRKDMLKRRKENAEYLKSFTIIHGNNLNYRVNGYQGIVNLMKEAMNSNGYEAVPRIRRVLFAALLRQTNELQESIYTQPVKGDYQP